MILITGATGCLGPEVTRLLATRGLPLRVMARRPLDRALPAGAELVQADVTVPASMAAAVAGAAVVISAVSGFSGKLGGDPAAVDRDGVISLVRAAAAAGVEHFVMLSVRGAAPNHRMELMRMKFAAEEALRVSGMEWTILRPSLFMENWADLVGRPLREKGQTLLFGHCRNPINFVSTHDVARLVELAVVDPGMRGRVIEVGGPENLTFRQFAAAFQPPGMPGTVKRIPRPMMRMMGVVARPFNPVLARHARAGVVMDSTDMTFDASSRRVQFPSVPMTTLAEVAAGSYASVAGGVRLEAISRA